MDRIRRSTLRGVGVGFGLMILGLVVGLLSNIITFQMLGNFGQTAHGQWISRRGLQYGFLILAVGYIGYRSSVGLFVRIKRPSLEGLGWILLGPVALIGIGLALDPVLEIIGISMDHGAPTADPTESLSQFAVFFIISWLVAAPAEELLFRGVIQGRLRETMRPVGAITVGAIIFALMHVLIGVIDGQSIGEIVGWGIETLVSGLLFGAAYERTENLLIPSVIHATMWTLPYVILV